eukprot:8880661-Pyramimonas_sp.AAC.1
MEKLAAKGIIAQFRAQRITAGGRDPRVVSAKDMGGRGVELQRARPAAVSKRGGARANLKYAHQKCGRMSEAMGREAYLIEFKKALQDYTQLGSATKKELQPSIDRERQGSRAMPELPGSASSKPASLFDLAGDGLPLATARCLQRAGRAAVDANASFESWGPACREDFQRGVFVMGQLDMPDKNKYVDRAPCYRQNPGICRSKVDEWE